MITMDNLNELIKQIRIYGDSILKGVMLDKNTNKYYVGIKDNMEKITTNYPINIVNNTRFGCTITKGYEQLTRDLKTGFECDYIILEYGGNDCDFNWQEVSDSPDKKHLPHTPIHMFKKTYVNMIKELKAKNITPILISLPPISAHKYIDWISRNLNKDNIISWLKDVDKLYRYQELYSRTVENIAKETGCLFVDVRTKFLEKDNIDDYLCEDGIHPNKKGHKIILKAFTDFLDTNEIKGRLAY